MPATPTGAKENRQQAAADAAAVGEKRNVLTSVTMAVRILLGQQVRPGRGGEVSNEGMLPVNTCYQLQAEGREAKEHGRKGQHGAEGDGTLVTNPPATNLTRRGLMDGFWWSNKQIEKFTTRAKGKPSLPSPLQHSTMVHSPLPTNDLRTSYLQNHFKSTLPINDARAIAMTT